MFYPVKMWPYFAVIDPRTGENLGEWNETDPRKVFALLAGFLADHAATPSAANGLPPKRLRPSASEEGRSVIDLSEDSQLEAAIKASLAETQVAEEDGTFNSDSDVETFSDSDNGSRSSFSSPRKKKAINVGESSTSSTAVVKKGILSALEAAEDSKPKQISVNSMATKDSWKQFLGDDKDPETKLLLRMPDGQKIHVSMPCSSQVQVCVKWETSFRHIFPKIFFSL
jgi:hypothetical protein